MANTEVTLWRYLPTGSFKMVTCEKRDWRKCKAHQDCLPFNAITFDRNRDTFATVEDNIPVSIITTLEDYTSSLINEEMQEHFEEEPTNLRRSTFQEAILWADKIDRAFNRDMKKSLKATKLPKAYYEAFKHSVKMKMYQIDKGYILADKATSTSSVYYKNTYNDAIKATFQSYEFKEFEPQTYFNILKQK